MYNIVTFCNGSHSWTQSYNYMLTAVETVNAICQFANANGGNGQMIDDDSCRIIYEGDEYLLRVARAS